MNYECIYCGAELTHEDIWGVGPYCRHDNDQGGETCQCPNHNRFDTEESAWGI